MTAPTTVPAETLIRHAWDLYEQDPECDGADSLRHAVWQLEEAVDYDRDDVEQLARCVVQSLSIATSDEVDDLLAPMPSVATWLGFDR
ncbi:hypothetical protein [Gordonia sp. SCSIO 19800]|uniref:hypothetical protein n=1 Tax=Gordonia sp. SCSIO 19800 TaxID=2826926 RepID=UPI001B81A454|nr:hypothetical protein [Gordonia sp. SCSIO 19800]MBR7194086.1 hypothetical protein [Gordonia sp. SCSIO 19800]